jgi:hypothetical protein
MVLCVNRIPKNRFPEVLCVFRTPTEQTPDSMLSGKFTSIEKSEYRRSNSLRKTLLQIAVELCGSNLSSPLLLRYLTTTLEHIALWEILLKKEILG